ncbi:DinB family protein [Saccharopolyspora griseoalba]|uniref:DinB family protein n=1 Tax=Saccharopolyspora griseoalba TaxID=1431848 RepID=A0ABW2LT71_9PSEU
MPDERADLLDALRIHREFLRFAVRGVDESQARLAPTTSELCLGGILKHVSRTEENWVRFLLEGPSALAMTPESMERHAAGFRMTDEETVESLLAEYDRVSARTDELVASLPDLSAAQPLPEAPWFPPGATRSARRVFMHIVAETAQHAGHADIIRETIDGQRTMG